MKIEGSGLKCPKCETKLDGETSISTEGAEPSPGDVSVCVYCLLLLEFVDSDDGLSVRELNKNDAPYELLEAARILAFNRIYGQSNV